MYGHTKIASLDLYAKDYANLDINQIQNLKTLVEIHYKECKKERSVHNFNFAYKLYN